MVRKWTHGGAEPISSFPRSLSQEYKVAFDRGGTGPCGPPPQHWSAGLCVWMERGRCGQVRRLRISMVLVLKRTFPSFWKQQLIHRHCPRASGWQACAGGEGGGGGVGGGGAGRCWLDQIVGRGSHWPYDRPEEGTFDPSLSRPREPRFACPMPSGSSFPARWCAGCGCWWRAWRAWRGWRARGGASHQELKQI